MTVRVHFSTLKHESDLSLLTGGENIAQAVNRISVASRKPKERLLSGLGWGWLVTAGAAIIAVTWFVIHVPI